MKGLSLFILVALLLTINNIKAQDSKVLTGIVAYERQDYKKALNDLDKALVNPDQLKKKNVATAYYYRAKTWMGLYLEAARTKDLNWFKEHPKALVYVYDNYKQAEKNDQGKLEKSIESELNSLRSNLLNVGLQELTKLQRTKVQTEKKQLYESCMEHLNLCVNIEQDYLVYDLMSQASSAYEFGSEKSWEYAQKCIELYTQKPPKTPDYLIIYAYYRKALVERYSHKEMTKAWETTKQGKAKADEIAVKIKSLDITNSTRNEIQKKLETAKNDLTKLELDILLNAPDLYDKALEEFEKAIKAEPNNYIIHVAYANLLENKSYNQAIEMYKKAISINPDKESAYFNLGAIYNNQALEVYKKSVNESDYEKAAQINKEVDVLMAKAYEQFKKVYEINPKSLDAIRALKQIAIRLEKLEEYKEYKEAEKKLVGN